MSKVDGHDINRKFMTDNYNIVLIVSEAVSPLIVTKTDFCNKEDAEKLFNDLSHYEETDPLDYICSVVPSLNA